MIGKLSNSGIRPVALGANVNASAYGSTIPVYLGRTKGSLYLTWEANIRKTGSKLKKKKNVDQYAANVDFLVGHNPILSPLQFWANQNQRFPLNFTVQRTGSLTVSDPNFYAVIAVTAAGASPQTTFNDYGNVNAPIVVPGAPWEVPLWNAAFNGPDPTWSNSFRQRWSYTWTPEMGPTIRLNNNPGGTICIYYAQLFPDGSKAYGKKESGTDIPCAALHLTWEPILGDGPEYTGNDSTSGALLSDQQIFYPCYAGLGSDNFQTGMTGLPEVQAEFIGAYGINPEGDADFCDMIEDVFKQGLSQPGFTTSQDPTEFQALTTHQLQRGLNCYELPGPVQSMIVGDVDPFSHPMHFSQPNTAGNILIALAASDAVTGTANWSISDTAGNTWTALFPGGQSIQAWWATAKASSDNTVNIAGFDFNWEGMVFEIAGVDTVEAATVHLNASYPGGDANANLITNSIANAGPGQAGYLLAAGLWQNFFVGANNTGAVANVPFWNLKTTTAAQSSHITVYERRVYTPGEYTINIPGVFPFSHPTGVVMFALSQSQPSPYPQPLGNILDDLSMLQTRAQCKAAGIWGSLCMDSQKKASDWLQDLYTCANAAPVWSGFKLKSVPYSEISGLGHGAIYNAPTATGPTILTIGDFIYDEGSPIYECERTAQVDVPTTVQIQFPNRSGDYNDTTVSEPQSATTALFGSRKDSPQQLRMIQDPAVARKIMNVAVRRKNQKNTYKFKLNASRKLLEPMDLVRLPEDPLTGTAAVDVRLTSVEESDQLSIDCEAEPFVYGLNSVIDLPVTAYQGYAPQSGASAGDVNPPIIFEPVPRLANSPTPQLWMVVSCPPGQLGAIAIASGGTGYTVGNVLTVVQTGAANGQVTVSAVTGGVITALTPHQPGKHYSVGTAISVTGGTGSGATVNIVSTLAAYGGCVVYVSTDDGTSYIPVPGTSTISGNGKTGAVVVDWPAHADPDTENNLLLDMSESGETLDSYQVVDEDNFNYPCYVEGGADLDPILGLLFGVNLGCIPYELMTYARATLL